MMNGMLAGRFESLPATPLEDTLTLRAGDMRDYTALCGHHYRSARPATATRVFTLCDERVTVSGRFMRRASRMQVVGVLVESLPALSCRLRDEALHDRYGGIRDGSMRSRLLNKELRCISRVIVHPQWRGLGLAVRLVRAALDQPATMFTESLAAMGHVHPFFERAGMTAYRRPPHEFDQRLSDALAAAGFDLTDLAALDRMVSRIESLPEPKREWLLRELHGWHARMRRQSSAGAPSPRQILTLARQRLLCEPVYYLSDNRQSL